MDKTLRALRQKRNELAEEQYALKAEARSIWGNPEGDDGHMSEAQDAQLKTIEDRLDAVDQEMLQNGKDLLRYEQIAEEDISKAVAVMTAEADEKPGDDNNGLPRLFSDFGEQLQAIHAMAYGRPDQRLLDLNAAAIGQGETIGSEGGFLVQPDFAAEIYRKMTFESALLSQVRRQGVSGNGLVIRTVNETSRATGSRWGGVRGYWVDEGTAPTASQLKFGRLELSLVKLAALGYATDELLADAAALSGLMTQAFAEELSFLTEDAVINGTGAQTPLGILNADCLVSVAKEGSQAAATILTANLSKMWARLHVRSRARAVWLVNQDVEPELDNLFLAGASSDLNPRIVTYNQVGAVLIKGRPILPVEYCKTLGTKGDIILADLDQYMLIDKGGIRQDSSMHVRFTTDEMAFRAIYRVDGQPLWESALTPFNGTNTVSPFISLDTRA